MISQARSLTEANPSPGGSIRAFCAPVMATSTPQSSGRSGKAPAEVMQSASSSLPASRQTLPIASRSQAVAVEVSLCTTITAVMAGSRASRSATISAVGGVPHSIS